MAASRVKTEFGWFFDQSHQLHRYQSSSAAPLDDGAVLMLFIGWQLREYCVPLNF
jgi:hypothetical protein